MVLGRDECVAAYVPDHQWDLLQQSLKEHKEGVVQADVATDVVVEAGLLVRSCLHPYESPCSNL